MILVRDRKRVYHFSPKEIQRSGNIKSIFIIFPIFFILGNILIEFKQSKLFMFFLLPLFDRFPNFVVVILNFSTSTGNGLNPIIFIISVIRFVFTL